MSQWRLVGREPAAPVWRRSVSGVGLAVLGVLAAGSLASMPRQAPLRTVADTSMTSVDVLGWGGNAFSQLGAGPTVQLTPVSVPGLPDDVTQVAVGDLHSLALRADGSVLAWGSNGFGQLGNGDGSVQIDPTPAPVVGLSGVVQIAAGDHFNLALRADGTVWAWGLNNFGEIGVGAPGVQLTARQVPGLAGVVQVAAGFQYALALLADGTVRAWGENALGELGDGHPTDAPVPAPVTVSGLSGVTRIAAGGGHSLALLADGSVRAWGGNGSGQIGDGTKGGERDTPVVVPALSNVVQVDAGEDDSLVLRDDGTVWAWGFNGNGQVGGADRFVLTPRRVPELAGVTQVVAGGAHNLAVLADGSLWAWGFNGSGELGNGTTTGSPTPVRVVGVQHVVTVAAGDGHNLATVATPGFAIALSPTDGFIVSSGSVTTQVSLTPGSTGIATLTATNLPAGTTASFSATQISLGNPVTLTLTSDGTTPSGDYQVRVLATPAKGTAGTPAQSAIFELIIQGQAGPGGDRPGGTDPGGD